MSRLSMTRLDRACVPPKPAIIPAFTISAFTMIEVLIVISVVTLLIAIALPVIGAVRGQSRSVQCMSNLRQIGLLTEAVAMAHADLFPFWVANMPASPPVERLAMVDVYEEVRAGLDCFVCPADRSAPSAGIDYTSYDYGPGALMMHRLGRDPAPVAIRQVSEEYRRNEWDVFADRIKWHPGGRRNSVSLPDWRARTVSW